MEIRDIKKIVELMKNNDLTEFEMEDDQFRIGMRRGPMPSEAPVQQMMMAPQTMAPAPVAATAAPAAAAAAPADEDDGLITINTPIVGTFYRAPSPESDAYVSVGDSVTDDKVVCIIEAMKVMNEIQAECKGVIKQILVEDGTPVEYGQPLFKVQPA